METTKHKLPENTNRFFINLSNYLDTQILFFGSVQRQDYFPGHSDIDIVIFTDNEKSLLTKLQHFLKVDRAKIKKTVMRLYHNNHVVHGYKLMYKNPELVAPIEMSIYNEKSRESVMYSHMKKSDLPFYTLWLLVILKIMYYNLHFIDHSTFRYLKKNCLLMGVSLPDDDYIVIGPESAPRTELHT